jgi:hypothetical protein
VIDNGHELVYGYVDSDFVGDLDKRRSTSGYVLFQVELLVGYQCYKTLLLYPLHKKNT